MLGAEGDAVGRLAVLGEEFWGWRSRQTPRTRDDIPRRDRPSGWLPAWSAGDVSGYLVTLSGFEQRLAAIGGDLARSAPVADYVDGRLLASAIARARFELEVLPLWRRDPWFYLDQSIGTVFDSLLRPPPFGAGRVDELLGRLAAIPATLAIAEENLSGSLAAELCASALAVAPGAPGDLETALGALVEVVEPAAAEALQSAGAAAGRALDRFARWLAAAAPSADPLGGAGRAVLERWLYEVALLPYTPEELLAAGRQEWDRAVAFELFEQHRVADAGWPELPASAEAQCKAERAGEAEVRAFYVSQRLLSQPEWLRHYTNLPLPAWLAPLRWLGVTDDLTGPGRLGEDGVSYVPEPTPALPYFYRANAADPRAGVIHEGAHYQQLALSWANERPARRHFYDSCPNEGIAFYNEELLTRTGLFEDAPVSQQIVCNFLRLRALRVEVDLRIALGEWSIEEGAAVLARRVPMDPETAGEEAAFFAATPAQGSSYLTGKLQLWRLLADAVGRAGEAGGAGRVAGDGDAGGGMFDLQRFHDSVWRNGNVPFALQRLDLLGDGAELARVDELRAAAGIAAGPVPGRPPG